MLGFCDAPESGELFQGGGRGLLIVLGAGEVLPSAGLVFSDDMN